MTEMEYIDFKKEFEEFKRELESSKPIFNDDSIEFNEFDNLISNSKDNVNIGELESFSNFNENYPNISLETEDILMNLTIRKDYSTIDDLEKRKEEFIKDLKEFIDEFGSTEESTKLMEFYER